MDSGPFRTTAPEGLDQVLSLDQIRSLRSNNDYVERPGPGCEGPQTGFFFVHEDRVYPVHALPRSLSLQPHLPHPPHLSRSSTVSSSLSDQRLLPCASSCASSHSAVRSQPELQKASTKAAAGVDHMFICERCGRCKCRECCGPRGLPSCWACGQRCLCSPQTLVEDATCLCCVRGLFYHCSSDEEDSCADRPCSCSGPRCCGRWGALSLLTLCLPCLCCYPPARLCLAVCRRVHDRVTRPGCRCSNSNTVCRKSATATTTRSKTVDKLL